MSRAITWARIGLLVIALGCGACLDSDDALIRRFHDHRATFDHLVAMSDSDSTVVRIAYTFTRLYNNWSWPRDDSLIGLTPARWHTSRAVFDTLGLKDGLQRESTTGDSIPGRDAVLTLWSSSFGMVNRGEYKGYVFSRHPLDHLRPSLDDRALDGARHGYALRSIAPNWYLDFEW